MKEIFRKEIMERDVLNRILWEKKLNPADFDIYYLDRITKKLNKVKFTDIKFEWDFFSIGESLSLIRNSSEFRGYEFPTRKISF